MPAKQSVIKCPKCGYLPNMLGDTCLKCNTRLEKICGECGFANPVEKNYCDQCGSVLALHPPPKSDTPPPPPSARTAQPFKVEMESIQDTVSERATSFRRKPADAPPPPAPAPPSARPGQATSVLTPDSARLPPQTGLPRPLKATLLRRFAGTAFTLLLVFVLFFILYRIAAPSLPRLRLLMTAKSYLTNISEGRYEKAYELLSANSRAACTLNEYVRNSREYYAKAPAWQFKDAQVFALDKNTAVVRYQLKEGTSAWKNDYISFIRENSRWTRPYIWILFQPIEDALKRQDFPHAVFLSQKLYLTDPIDPRSSGYLCDSEFFMGLYEKAAESCKRTADSAATYPVGYTSKDLFGFTSRYADSLRYLERDRVAITEYEKLLNWPDLTGDEQCPIYLNRADSYVAINDYDRALQDVLKAGSFCTQSPSKEEAGTRLGYMSGGAGNEAIAFAQKSRFQPGMPPIGEARRLQLEALKVRLGPKNAKLLPRDQWLAVHVAGPEYRVFLRHEVSGQQNRKKEPLDIYVFLVNLWTGKVKLEKAPAPPGAPPKGK